MSEATVEVVEEIIDLPSGDRVVYIDKHPTSEQMNHSYWRWNETTGKKGRRLTGVTTACKVFDLSPDNLMKWAAKQQMIGASRLVEALGAEKAVELMADPESCWAELEARAWTFNDVKEKAGAEGTNVHRQAFEALAAGSPVPDLVGLGEREVGLSKGVQAFWFDHGPGADYFEQVVYSASLGVAGRADMLGSINPCGRPECGCSWLDLDEGPGIVDLKTGNFLGAAAHAQVGGGYPKLAVDSGFEKPAWAAMVQVREDGTYQVVPAEFTPEDFEIGVLAYRAAGRSNGAAARARDQRRKVREQVEADREAVAA